MLLFLETVKGRGKKNGEVRNLFRSDNRSARFPPFGGRMEASGGSQFSSLLEMPTPEIYQDLDCGVEAAPCVPVVVG